MTYNLWNLHRIKCCILHLNLLFLISSSVLSPLFCLYADYFCSLTLLNSLVNLLLHLNLYSFYSQFYDLMRWQHGIPGPGYLFSPEFHRPNLRSLNPQNHSHLSHFHCGIAMNMENDSNSNLPYLYHFNYHQFSTFYSLIFP